MRTLSRLCCGLLLGSMVAFTPACLAPWHPHGGPGSDDSFTYYSLPHQPQTVTLVDTRSGEKLWTCEIPVGQQLCMRFVNQSGQEAKGEDLMRWKLMPLGQDYGTLDNRFACPPRSCRRVDVTLRQGPEYVPTENKPVTAATK